MNSHNSIRHILAIESGTWKKKFFLDKNSYSIGRNSTNSLIINHRVISRNHASLIKVTYTQKKSNLSESIFWLIDGDLKGNRSTNGIYVNGKQCTCHRLQPGDVILLGGVEVKAKYDIVNVDTKTFFSVNPPDNFPLFLPPNVDYIEKSKPDLPLVTNQDLEKFELMSEGILIIDGDNRQVITANSSYCYLTDYIFSDLISLKFEDLFLSENNIIDYDFNLLQNNSFSSKREAIQLTKNSNFINVLICLNPISYNHHPCLLISVENINELKKGEEIIRFQTNYDYATNLPNKKLFIEQLFLALGHNKLKDEHLAIIKLRLNNWREISYALDIDYQHKLLQNILKQIKTFLTAGDTIAKWSDDEYVIMIEDVKNQDKLTERIENIITNINQLWSINDRNFLININLGISIHPLHGEDTFTLLKNASLALEASYQKTFDNYQYYNHELNYQQKSTQLLIFEAIKNNKIKIKYFPIINIHNPELFSIHAIFYGEEIESLDSASILKESVHLKLISNLIKDLFNQMASDINVWKDNHLMITKITVDMLISCLLDPDYIDYLIKIIKTKNISNLEINIILDIDNFNGDLLNHNLSKLNELGITFNFYDFDIVKLKTIDNSKVTFSGLKISSSLTKNIEDNSPKRPLIYNLISLANSLNIKVIAEGINSETQKDILVNLGCKEMEGMFFTPPLSGNEVLTFSPDIPFEVVS